MTGDTNVLWLRALAHVLDVLLPPAVALFIAAAVGDDSGAVWFILSVLFSLGQILVLQGLTGYTAGKFLSRIRVVDSAGRPPGVLAALKRTLPLFFEWFGLVAIFAIWHHPHGQRFGDRWAKTYVVRARRGEVARPLGLAT